MTARRVVVVSGGLRQPSSTRLLADRLAEAAARALRRRGVDAATTVVELREHAHDLTNSLLTGFPAGTLRGVVDEVVGADGLIAVSPIFNASYSGLFKSFFDVLDPGSLEGMPVLIGATGGTARHSLALEHAVRPMFTHLRAATVPTAVFAAPEDWGASPSVQARQRARMPGVEAAPAPRPDAERGPAERGLAERGQAERGLAERVDRAAGELAALVAERPRARPADPYDDPTPFADLLSGS